MSNPLAGILQTLTGAAGQGAQPPVPQLPAMPGAQPDMANDAPLPPPGGMPDPMNIQFESPQQSNQPTPDIPVPMEDDVGVTAERSNEPYPDAFLKLSKKKVDAFRIWMDEFLRELISTQQGKQQEWVAAEEAYRALGGNSLTQGNSRGTSFSPLPFEGASRTTVPVIAMAVDPIHARLDTGIFKQDPVIKIKGLKKSILPYVVPLEQFVDYTQKHLWHLRSVFSPAMLEFCKLGTMFFCTEYEVEEYDTMMYDAKYQVVKKRITTYKGPKVTHVSSGDMLFPADYTNLQDPPLIAQRVRTTLDKLRIMQASNKIKKLELIEDFERYDRTPLEEALADASSHYSQNFQQRDMVVYRVWGDYDLYGNGLPVKFVAVYHLDSSTLVSLRLNWYFNQRRPYTAIPYTVTNNSIYGLGVCEMVKPFQDAITQWERMASDNAYIANIRMFIVRKGSGIEEVPRLYAGRCFFVDEPKSDFIPFEAGDTYPTTLGERQNLFGLVEKRTGVSDYLTGRESPIIGSRATATSTLALIQEGTKRVEQVLENIRLGVAEIIGNAFDIWIQYGVDGLDEMVFDDDETGQKVRDFFDNVVSHKSVKGSLAIDLSATDASGNRQVQQQLQLSIIQLMMGYYEKLMSAGQMIIQAQQQAPQLAQLITATMVAASKMFKDLLQKYDIRNPDDYLPDIQQYITGQPVGMQGAAQPIGGQGTGSPAQGPTGGTGAGPSLPPNIGPSQPAAPGSGGQSGAGGAGDVLSALAGASQGA